MKAKSGSNGKWGYLSLQKDGNQYKLKWTDENSANAPKEKFIMTSEKNGGNLVTFQWINPKTNRPSLFLATRGQAKQRGGNADYDDVIFSDGANKAQFSQLFRTGSTTEFALDLHGYLSYHPICQIGT